MNMGSKVDYKAILKQYPEIISKEQLRELCHISKRVAKYYSTTASFPAGILAVLHTSM